MTQFDTVLMVDWSGGNDRGARPVKDAIWAAVARDGGVENPVYLRNRQVAEDWIVDFLEAEKEAGRRVLAGFDFPFGYPKGFARALTGSNDPFAVWDWFATRVQDAADTNNRFDLAGQINRQFDGNGPFWANGLKRDIEGLSRTKPVSPPRFDERREVEHLAKGAFTCWQMAGAGAVGGQTIMGLPVLSRLRQKFDVAVWPFEPLDRSVAFVEIWPSLFVSDPPEGMIKDAWQVQQVARKLSMLSAQEMGRILDVQAPEEGWIFGVGHEDTLRAPVPPRLKNNCFALPPGVHWTPVSEALSALRDQLKPVTGVRKMQLRDAIGHRVAESVTAVRANPPTANTAVDGYGFQGERGPGTHVMPLAAERAAAGDVPGVLSNGHAVRILTGASLPEGVDTVILQEDVTVEKGQIAFRGPVKQGANTRAAGEDVRAGDEVLRRGEKIGPAEAAFLSASGVSEVACFEPLRVAVVSTGAELIEVGQTPEPGRIFDANRPMLLELLRRFGHVPVDMGIVPDDRETLRQVLNQASNQADLILTSGGASAGDEDHVSALLGETGAMTLWRVAIKPGRPLALGLWREKPVFGLPGNPVAAMVCALIFARPAMEVLAGGTWQDPQGFQVPAAFAKSKKAGRSEFLRARVREGRVEVFPSEGSGRISGLAWAEGLVELPMEAMEITPGTLVRYIPYGSFGI